jgi:hypothetical protein
MIVRTEEENSVKMKKKKIGIKILCEVMKQNHPTDTERESHV